MFRKAIVVGLIVASLSGTVASAQSIEERLQEISKSAGQSTDQHRFSGGGGPGSYGHIYRKIQIESDPPGASILINSRCIGPTPQVIRVDNQLSMIQIILSKPGYLETVRELDLANLTEPVIHIDLIPWH